MSRFPFGVPNSWFHVSYSDEIGPGELKPIHLLDRELVLFRTQSGVANVLDAHCSHLGAHLGKGGAVVGEHIQCPFHGWKFCGDGTCAGIPYTEKIPPKSKSSIRSWPVQEVNGRIFVWHDAEGRDPFFEIPVIPEYGSDEWTSSYEKYSWNVKTHPQEIMENAIDWPHFSTVHLMDMPDDRQEKFEGPMFYWMVQTRKDVQTMEGASDSFRIEAQNWGMGFNFLTYTGMFTTIVTAGLTPIDTETTEFTVGIIGKKDGRSDEETRGLLKAYMDDQTNAITQDFQIWENKGFRVRPMLCEGDGPIGQYRRWVRQFYSKPWWEAAA